jgi:hypothetical protein
MRLSWKTFVRRLRVGQGVFPYEVFGVAVSHQIGSASQSAMAATFDYSQLL